MSSAEPSPGRASPVGQPVNPTVAALPIPGAAPATRVVPSPSVVAHQPHPLQTARVSPGSSHSLPVLTPAQCRCSVCSAPIPLQTPPAGMTRLLDLSPPAGAGSCHSMLPQPSSCWHSLFFCILCLFHQSPINAVHGDGAEAHRALLLMELGCGSQGILPQTRSSGSPGTVGEVWDICKDVLKTTSNEKATFGALLGC